MNKRSTDARSIQAPQSSRETKTSCKAYSRDLQLLTVRFPTDDGQGQQTFAQRHGLRGPYMAAYLCITVHCKNGKWDLSYKQIADEMGISEKAAQRAISLLEKKGLIDIARGRGRGHRNRYTLPPDFNEIPASEKATVSPPLVDDRPSYQKATVSPSLQQKGDCESIERATVSPPVVEEVEKKEGRKEDQEKNPSFLKLSAAEIDFNHDMLSYVGFNGPLTNEIAASYPPLETFFVLCKFVQEQEAKEAADQKLTCGVLPTRFEDPVKFPRPDWSQCKETNFFLDFCHSVRAFYPEPEHESPQPEPLDTKPAPRPTDDDQSPESELWEKALEELQSQFPQSTFETWIRDTQLVSRKDSEILIITPTPFARDWLQKRGHRSVKRVLDSLIGQSVQVSFQAKGDPEPPADEVETQPPKDAAGRLRERRTAAAVGGSDAPQPAPIATTTPSAQEPRPMQKQKQTPQQALIDDRKVRLWRMIYDLVPDEALRDKIRDGITAELARRREAHDEPGKFFDRCLENIDEIIAAAETANEHSDALRASAPAEQPRTDAQEPDQTTPAPSQPRHKTKAPAMLPAIIPTAHQSAAMQEIIQT